MKKEMEKHEKHQRKIKESQERAREPQGSCINRRIKRGKGTEAEDESEPQIKLES